MAFFRCRGQNSEAPLSFLRRGLEESLYQQSTAKQGALARPKPAGEAGRGCEDIWGNG